MENKMKVYKLLIVAFIFFIAANMSAQVAVIANKSVSESAISASKLADIYLLKAKTWSNGKAMVPITIKSDNETVQKFFGSMGKSSMEMKKIWMKLQLTGEGQAPEAAGSEDEVVEKVASTPGAVGFISADKVNDKVKVLLKIN
jgi:ABC-type phosphate transport system substrate-binding protein